MSERYSRQELFHPIGPSGQARLGSAKVGLVGLGALGSVIAEMLVRAGIGHLIAIDRDFIEASNLHRQGLYQQEDVDRGLAKATAAAGRLKAVAPECAIDCRVGDFNAANAEELFLQCDLLLDGTDSFETRYLLNDLAIAHKIPWIYGACVAASGMTSTILPAKTPCLRCLFPDPPSPGSQETCDTLGIIAPAAHIVASLQVTEALKILTGNHEALRKSLLSIELWPFRMVELGGANPKPRADCRCCAEEHFDFLRGEKQPKAISMCGRNSVQIIPGNPGKIDLDDLATRLKGLGEIKVNGQLLQFKVETYQITLFGDGRALIKGTTDPAEARQIFARYIGN